MTFTGRISLLLWFFTAINAWAVHSDNLGSTGLQTDKSGNQIQNYGYSAYGQSRYTQSTNVFKVSRRYTGQVADDDTGLYYYNARYYDPVLGRFTQPDNAIPDLGDPQSYNRYAYCVNNPLRYTDPDGRWAQEVADWWAGTVNAGAGYASAGPSHWIWNGTVGTVSSIVGGVAAPLTLGSSAGAVSGNPNAGAKDYARATVAEGINVVSIVPVTAGAGRAIPTLFRVGEKEVAKGVVNGTVSQEASGMIKFQRWQRGDAIDKPLPNGAAPSWDTVRSRYWKNRYEATKNSSEFSQANLDRMQRGVAPQDYNPATGQWESRELHHVDPQRNGGANSPLNLREVTPDQHRQLDPNRK